MDEAGALVFRVAGRVQLELEEQVARRTGGDIRSESV